MAVPRTIYKDSREFVITLLGVRPYPARARELIEYAETRGWWAKDGLPVVVAPDGTHRIRVELGRAPIGGRNGYRAMILWTSDCSDRTQSAVEKSLIMSTEYPGWKATGVADIMAKIDRWPLIAPPVPADDAGTGGDHIMSEYSGQYMGRS